MRLLALRLRRSFLVLAAGCGGTIGSGGDAGSQDGDAAAIRCVPPVVEVSGHCAREADGTAWCWGWNVFGQLGDGTTQDRLSPVRVSTLGPDVAQLAASRITGCARRSDGTLWCWGANGNGAVGDGTTEDRSSPVQVAALGGAVAAVAVATAHTCARRSDGTLWCWGVNWDGTVGDGTTEDRSSPVQVAGLGTGVKQVSAGENHACACKSDGTVWCWGWNLQGAVGVPSMPPFKELVPVQVAALGATVVEVAAGAERTCARKSDGTLWCWGSDWLGDGAIHIRSPPVQVALLGSSVAEVSVGFTHTCARKTDGTLWCWGQNDHGAVGDGTTSDRSLPVQVASLGASVAQVSATDEDTCALTTDGAVWCWGRNTYGDVGDGTTDGVPCGDPDAGPPDRCHLTPVRVAGLCP